MSLDYTTTPLLVKRGALYFAVEENATDAFDENDVASWVAGGRFAWRWRDRGQQNETRCNVYMHLCNQVATQNLPVLEIACGPGLGLLPDILAFNPNIQATATDSSSVLIENWNDFFRMNEPGAKINFAAMDAAKMPIASNSVDIITSYIGFGSLKQAGSDQLNGLAEAFRVLKPGGRIYTVEQEFEDPALIQHIFDRWGRVNWFKDDKHTWQERFAMAGFIVEQDSSMYRNKQTGWELQDVAASFGLEVWTNTKAFVLRKP